MSRSWTGYLAGAAFVLCAAASGLAAAQGTTAADAQRDAQHDAAAGAARDRDEVRVMRHDDGDRHMERRMVIREDGGRHPDPAEHLRTMLQLKPGQEAALTAYLAAVKPDHAKDHIVEMSDHRSAKTTTERLAEMDAHITEQTAQAHARIAATKKFYDQLEPSQKKVFDQMPMLMLGPMGPMMPGGPMKVMVNMEGHGPMHMMDRMPPMPPMPPMPAAPPAPPRLD